MDDSKTFSQIAPSRIIAGLGNADREALSAYLALYEDAEVLNILLDTAKDWIRKGIRFCNSNSVSMPELSPAFQSRIKASLERIRSSEVSDDELRIRLWIHMREAFGLDSKLTRSRQGIADICNDLAASIVNIYRDPGKEQPPLWKRVAAKNYWDAIRKDIKSFFNSKEAPRSFSEVVRSIIFQLLNQATSDANIAVSEKDALLNRMRKYMEYQGKETIDSLLKQVDAEKLSDDALRKILASSSGAISTMAAVQMTGFSAYIFAAQASAVIPLIGGKTMVSILAVLANPIFVGSVIIGSVVLSGGKASTNILKAMTVAVSSLLTLQGLEKSSSGEEVMLTSFGNIRDMDKHKDNINSIPWEVIQKYKTAFYINDDLRKDLQFRRSTELSMVMEYSALPEQVDAIKLFLFPTECQSTEALILSALTIGDLVYHAAMIGPEVLAAADFSYSKDINNIADLGMLASHILERTGKSLLGTKERLKGYVAEQVVADRLIEQGYIVEFPDSASQKGYDLIVDGAPVQVKCFSGMSGLTEHFEIKGYEYPVIANSELAEAVAESDEIWTKNIYFIEGYDEAFVSELTNKSLESSAELHDQDVPFFAASVAAARNLHGWWKGQLTCDEAAWQIILQGSVKAGLGLIGGFAGKYAGLLLFGPAGAVIGNALIPVLLISRAKNIADNAERQANRALPAYSEWEKEAKNASENLLLACINGLDVKMNMLDKKCESVGETPLGNYARTRMQEDRDFLEELRNQVRYQLTKFNLSGEQTIKEALVLAWRSNVHPVVIQDELREVSIIMMKKPTAKEIIGEKIINVISKIKKSQLEQ